MQMVSCGADKSIIFREVATDRKGLPEFAIGNHVVGKTTLYDMEVDNTQKHVLTACQVRIFYRTLYLHTKRGGGGTDFFSKFRI